MKKLLILGSIAVLSIALITPAMATSTAISTSETNAAAEGGVGFGVVGDINSGNVTKVPESKRYFAPAGEINYPGAPNFFGGATPSYMDRLKAKDMLEYDPEGLTINECLMLRQDDNLNGKRIMVREKYGYLKKDQRLDKDTPIPVFFEKQDKQSLGTITVVSDDKKSIGPDVFAEAILKAWELGATSVHVKAEGFQREVHNEGAGWGFSWTGTTISGGQTSAHTGVMGFGKSWGQAGYYDHPFIVIVALAEKNIKFTPSGSSGANLGILWKDNNITE